MLWCLFLAASAAPTGRWTILVPRPDAELAVGDSIAVVYEETGGACVLTDRARVSNVDEEVEIELGAVDHGVAVWARQTGTLRVKADESLDACGGLPPVHRVIAPPEGVPLGLRRPAMEVHASRVRDLGALGSNWVIAYPDRGCVSPCVGELAVVHVAGPPTLFYVMLDPDGSDEPLASVSLPAGGPRPSKPGTNLAGISRVMRSKSWI